MPVIDVSEFTGSPEIMDGRVKTLHPRVHGGILMRGTDADRATGAGRRQADRPRGGQPLPVRRDGGGGQAFADCVENIDIGGPTMVRAAAKNHPRVSIVIDASDYAAVATLPAGPDEGMRKQLALKAFSHTATCDTAIAEWLQKELCDGTHTGVTALKYGNNPQQKPASVRGVLSPSGRARPLRRARGTPGYINLLDALNAWQLVKELGAATGLPAAASFKHVSPAGAAVYAPLDEEMMKVYEAAGKELSQTAVAYLRSRQADPLCSFGDFVAVSCEVDLSTAQLLKIEVSDGIIAPSYAPEALEILKAKKGGKYIVLQADEDYEPPAEEQRVVYGTDMRQARARPSTPDARQRRDRRQGDDRRREARPARRSDRDQVHAVELGGVREGRPDGVRRGPAVARRLREARRAEGGDVGSASAEGARPRVQRRRPPGADRARALHRGRHAADQYAMAPPTSRRSRPLTLSEKEEFLRCSTASRWPRRVLPLPRLARRGVDARRQVRRRGGRLIGHAEVIAAADEYKMVMASLASASSPLSDERPAPARVHG